MIESFMTEQWKPVTSFGSGTIYANGNERKIVTPGMSDFHYPYIATVAVVQLVRAMPILEQKTPAVK
jgi:hypothetical protein